MQRVRRGVKGSFKFPKLRFPVRLMFGGSEILTEFKIQVLSLLDTSRTAPFRNLFSAGVTFNTRASIGNRFFFISFFQAKPSQAKPSAKFSGVAITFLSTFFLYSSTYKTRQNQIAKPTVRHHPLPQSLKFPDACL